MAIFFVIVAIAIRYIAPHYLLPQLEDFPLVPAATALMLVAAAISVARQQVTVRLLPQLTIQWGLFVWAALCLTIADGYFNTIIFKADYIKDLIFITTIMAVVDQWQRLRWLMTGIVGALLVVGIFALPQLWGSRQCAEWKEGDMANLKFDGRSCHDVTDCFRNQPKVRLIPGLGPRLYRCERRGPFDVAAYVGRIRWVGVFEDSNNLGGTMASVIPLLLALWSNAKRFRKMMLFGAIVLLGVVILGTGSRGAQLSLALGTTVTIFGIWGRRAFKPLLLVAVFGMGLLIVKNQVSVREEDNFESSTKVSDRFRRDAMQAGFRLWTSYPLFGVGYQHFEDYHDIDPHNAYLASAAELGTLGLLLLALTMWSNFKGAIWGTRQMSQTGHEQMRRVGVGMLGYNIVVLIALTFFLSTYDKLTWLLPITVNTGWIRTVEHILPETKFRIDYRDVLILIPTVLLIMGLFYLGLMTSYTLS